MKSSKENKLGISIKSVYILKQILSLLDVKKKLKLINYNKNLQNKLKIDQVYFEKLDIKEGDSVKFDKVLLISDEKNVTVGNPYVKGATVEGTVSKNGKGPKIIVYKYKAKKNYRRTQGHRQPYTRVEIKSIKA